MVEIFSKIDKGIGQILGDGTREQDITIYRNIFSEEITKKIKQFPEGSK